VASDISNETMTTIRRIIACLIVVGVVACSDGGTQITIPVQHWNDTDVRIDTHPNPPLAGMSEIVVILTGPHGRPAGDVTVSLRGNASAPWVQAIQDGLIGVYRRAIDIGEGDKTVLQVRLQQGKEEKVLFFPIKLAASKD
jgi:hypothetical protein